VLTPFTTPLPALFGRLVLGLSNDRATPPSVGFVKKIFRVIYDMTKAKMAKYIGEAKTYDLLSFKEPLLGGDACDHGVPEEECQVHAVSGGGCF